MFKSFRDPVHNLIVFDEAKENIVLQLLDTPEMQRMRRIRQLGFSFMTYPGAEHSRFVHSLGVAYTVKRIIKILQEKDETGIITKFSEEDYLLALCAALLHDAGHGPFSHVLESITGVKHEIWTMKIIADDSTGVNKTLKEYDSAFPDKVVRVIKKFYENERDTGMAIVKLLSSQLDADRIDYILRDSIMTGAGYGKFDMEWLLNVMVLGKVNGRLEIGLDLKKGLSIAEDFIMARYYMYQNVYYHKATRSAEVIVRKILERVKSLSEGSRKKLEIPPALAKLLLKPNAITVDEYLEIDDYMLWYCFSRWARSSQDEVLKNLCLRLLNRCLLKSLDINTSEIKSYEKFFEKIQKLKAKAAEKGEEFKFLVVTDESSTEFYRDNYIYSERKDDEVNDSEVNEQIFLFDKNGKAHELSGVSEIVNAVRNKSVPLKRVYFPEELDKEVEDILGIKRK